jgi:hypothetical protein
VALPRREPRLSPPGGRSLTPAALVGRGAAHRSRLGPAARASLRRRLASGRQPAGAPPEAPLRGQPRLSSLSRSQQNQRRRKRITAQPSRRARPPAVCPLCPGPSLRGASRRAAQGERARSDHVVLVAGQPRAELPQRRPEQLFERRLAAHVGGAARRSRCGQSAKRVPAKRVVPRRTTFPRRALDIWSCLVRVLGAGLADRRGHAVARVEAAGQGGQTGVGPGAGGVGHGRWDDHDGAALLHALVEQVHGA